MGNYKKFRQFSALRFVNMNKLLEISNNLKNKARCCSGNLTDVSLDEEQIFPQNYEAQNYMRKMMCREFLSFRN